MFAYDWFKFLAFKFDPETAHTLSLKLLSQFPASLANIFDQKEIYPRYQTTLKCGLKWPFPVGLAAGLDKNAVAIDFFSSLLFGALEVGTVTPRPQKGNPRPRIFRLQKEQSLLNRLGFNNLGMEKIQDNIDKAHTNNKILGINLGKNKDTPLEKAFEDYRILYQTFAPLADYLVINVSSPNTPELRKLQQKEHLTSIGQALQRERKKNPRPLFLKIDPDLELTELDGIIQSALDLNLSGIIATNTTVMPELGQGGVSGGKLKLRAQKMRREILSRTGPNGPLDVIGVGGIASFEDLYQFWKLGGRAVQIYTSFIYQGPALLKDIQKGIDQKLEKHGLKSLDELFQHFCK